MSCRGLKITLRGLEWGDTRGIFTLRCIDWKKLLQIGGDDGLN